jgi:hypothetical protein
MDTIRTKTSLGLNVTQIAWVVKDIKTAKRFFQLKLFFFDTSKKIGVMTEVMGIPKEGEMAVRKMKGEDT